MIGNGFFSISKDWVAAMVGRRLRCWLGRNPIFREGKEAVANPDSFFPHDEAEPSTKPAAKQPYTNLSDCPFPKTSIFAPVGR